MKALWADTAFLAGQGVMDYSLLVGVDSPNGALVVGIIDFLRQVRRIQTDPCFAVHLARDHGIWRWHEPADWRVQRSAAIVNGTLASGFKLHALPHPCSCHALTVRWGQGAGATGRIPGWDRAMVDKRRPRTRVSWNAP